MVHLTQMEQSKMVIVSTDQRGRGTNYGTPDTDGTKQNVSTDHSGRDTNTSTPDTEGTKPKVSRDHEMSATRLGSGSFQLNIEGEKEMCSMIQS